ncbi:hypothetical protein MTP99_009175, partial [Tenebrio molitor]
MEAVGRKKYCCKYPGCDNWYLLVLLVYYACTHNDLKGYQKNNKVRTGKAGGSVKMQ